MRRFLFVSALLVITMTVMGQAKKPVIMVIPSDSYCAKNGYTQEWVDENGVTNTISDLKNAFNQADSEDLRLVVAELSKIMAERGFPLKDLEQTMKSMQSESLESSMLQSNNSGASILESPIDQIKRTAKPDIILDLDYTIKERGPKRFVTYILRAVDAYSNKVIAANSGDGTPSASASVGLLLEEAVINYMDSFCGQLMTYFEDMQNNGREIVVKLKVWDNAGFNFETEYNYDGEDLELTDIIEYWMQDNTKNGAPTRTSASENYINYEQVRIPLYKERNGKPRAIGAREFIRDLSNYLKDEPFQITSKIYERGLGEVWLILGEK